MTSKNIIKYTIIYYITTLLFTVILAIIQETTKISSTTIILPQLAPAVSVFAILALIKNSNITLNFTIKNQQISNYILAVLVPFIVFGIGFAVTKYLGLETTINSNVTQVLAPFLGGIIIGAIGEEIGWRGFLQPHLEKKYTVLKSSIITGMLWGLWHIGNYQNGALYMIGFLMFTIGSSIVLRKILDHTNNSLLVSILFHVAINISFLTLFKDQLTSTTMIITNGLLWIVFATLITAFFTKPTKFTHKQTTEAR